MTREEALDFLRHHQPLPPDEELTDETIQRFDAVRVFFKQHPDHEAIPLLLNAFGDGSGFGVYQIVGDTIFQFAPEEVIPHLLDALRSQHTGVRSWCAEIAAEYDDPRIVEELRRLLNDPDVDVRESAETALEIIDFRLAEKARRKR